MKGEQLSSQRAAMRQKAGRLGKAGMLWCIVIIVSFLISAAPAICRADDTVDERLAFSVGDDWHLALFPSGHVYDPYIADPIRPGFSLIKMSVMDSDIPDAGKSRYNFMLGGQYGLLKLRNSDFPDMAIQLDIYGSFLGQFDIDNSTDNIGWDGYYGVMLTWTDGHGLSLKLAKQHDSSHVGDEYEERTGRRRIGYTREEVVFGLSYRFPELFRTYAETGYATDLRNSDLQKPWRVKGGLEFEDKDRFFNGRLGYYAAVDLTSTEETDWDTGVTVQAGIVLPVRHAFQTVRFGPIYHNGRSLIGEFFQDREEWWGLGLWIDM